MKILVTGGLGYIGSHMVVELIKNEYDVIIIDNLSNSEIFILDNIEKITGVLPVFYNINLLDTHKLEEVFNSHKIDGIIHFAAFKSVSESVKNPFRYYNNNLNSLMNILNFMNDKNIENIVFLPLVLYMANLISYLSQKLNHLKRLQTHMLRLSKFQRVC